MALQPGSLPFAVKMRTLPDGSMALAPTGAASNPLTKQGPAKAIQRSIPIERFVDSFRSAIRYFVEKIKPELMPVAQTLLLKDLYFHGSFIRKSLYPQIQEDQQDIDTFFLISAGVLHPDKLQDLPRRFGFQQIEPQNGQIWKKSWLPQNDPPICDHSIFSDIRDVGELFRFSPVVRYDLSNDSIEFSSTGLTGDYVPLDKVKDWAEESFYDALLPTVPLLEERSPYRVLRNETLLRKYLKVIKSFVDRHIERSKFSLSERWFDEKAQTELTHLSNLFSYINHSNSEFVNRILLKLFKSLENTLKFIEDLESCIGLIDVKRLPFFHSLTTDQRAEQLETNVKKSEGLHLLHEELPEIAKKVFRSRALQQGGLSFCSVEDSLIRLQGLLYQIAPDASTWSIHKVIQYLETALQEDSPELSPEEKLAEILSKYGDTEEEQLSQLLEMITYSQSKTAIVTSSHFWYEAARWWYQEIRDKEDLDPQADQRLERINEQNRMLLTTTTPYMILRFALDPPWLLLQQGQAPQLFTVLHDLLQLNISYFIKITANWYKIFDDLQIPCDSDIDQQYQSLMRDVLSQPPYRDYYQEKKLSFALLKENPKCLNDTGDDVSSKLHLQHLYLVFMHELLKVVRKDLINMHETLSDDQQDIFSECCFLYTKAHHLVLRGAFSCYLELQEQEEKRPHARSDKKKLFCFEDLCVTEAKGWLDHHPLSDFIFSTIDDPSAKQQHFQFCTMVYKFFRIQLTTEMALQASALKSAQDFDRKIYDRTSGLSFSLFEELLNQIKQFSTTCIPLFKLFNQEIKTICLTLQPLCEIRAPLRKRFLAFSKFPELVDIASIMGSSSIKLQEGDLRSPLFPSPVFIESIQLLLALCTDIHFFKEDCLEKQLAFYESFRHLLTWTKNTYSFCKDKTDLSMLLLSVANPELEFQAASCKVDEKIAALQKEKEKELVCVLDRPKTPAKQDTAAIRAEKTQRKFQKWMEKQKRQSSEIAAASLQEEAQELHQISEEEVPEQEDEMDPVQERKISHYRVVVDTSLRHMVDRNDPFDSINTLKQEWKTVKDAFTDPLLFLEEYGKYILTILNLYQQIIEKEKQTVERVLTKLSVQDIFLEKTGHIYYLARCLHRKQKALRGIFHFITLQQPLWNEYKQAITLSRNQHTTLPMIQSCLAAVQTYISQMLQNDRHHHQVLSENIQTFCLKSTERWIPHFRERIQGEGTFDSFFEKSAQNQTSFIQKIREIEKEMAETAQYFSDFLKHFVFENSSFLKGDQEKFGKEIKDKMVANMQGLKQLIDESRHAFHQSAEERKRLAPQRPPSRFPAAAPPHRREVSPAAHMKLLFSTLEQSFIDEGQKFLNLTFTAEPGLDNPVRDLEHCLRTVFTE